MMGKRQMIYEEINKLCAKGHKAKNRNHNRNKKQCRFFEENVFVAISSLAVKEAPIYQNRYIARVKEITGLSARGVGDEVHSV